MTESDKEKGSWAFDEIPSDWAWLPFSEVFENVSDSKRKLAKSKYLPSGRFPVIDQGEEHVGGYTDDESLTLPSEPPYIVFGDHTRCVKYVDSPFVQGADGIKVFKTKNVDPRYAYWVLRTLRLPDKGYSRHFKFLKPSMFPIAPLRLQRPIAEKIEELFSELDAGVVSLERSKANLKLYRASVLKAAVEGKLTEQWRKENPDVEPASVLLNRILEERREKWEAEQLAGYEAKGKKPPKAWMAKYKSPKTAVSDGQYTLPRSWCWAAAEQLTRPAGPIRYGIIKPGPDTPGGVPYVRVTEMKTGRIDIDSLRRCNRERASKFQAATLISNDILISKDGTIGKVAIVPTELEGGNITQHVLRLSASKHLDHRYIACAIESPHCQQRMKLDTKGVALQGVNVEDFRCMAIPLPSRQEQEIISRTIDELLSIVDAAEMAVAESETKVRTLRQATLSAVFEGKLVY